MSAHTSHLSGKDIDGSQIFPVEKEMPKQGETTVRRYGKAYSDIRQKEVISSRFPITKSELARCCLRDEGPI